MGSSIRRRLVLAGTILVMAGVSACTGTPDATDTPSEGTSGGEDVELRMMWWGGDARHEITNEVLDVFEEQNPGITVVRDYGGFDGYRDKLLTQYAGGQAPDVFQLYNEVLYEFAGNGQLMDLNTQGDNGLSLDALPADLLESLSVDGEQSALPFGLNTHVMVFNAAALEAAGASVPDEEWAWEDLATLGKALSDAGDGQAFGVADISGSYQPFEVWAKQHGEEYMTVDGLGFSEETLASWWQYWEEMRSSGASTPADLTAEYSAPQDMMIAGDALSGFMFSNQYDSTQEQVEDELAVVRFPGEFPDPGQYLRTAMNIVMSADTEHPEASAKLIDFLINSEDANSILGIERGVPANADVNDAATEGLDDVTLEALAIIDQVREHGAAPPVPQPAGAANVNALFQEISDRVAFGQMTVEEGAADFMQRAPSELANG